MSHYGQDVYQFVTRKVEILEGQDGEWLVAVSVFGEKRGPNGELVGVDDQRTMTLRDRRQAEECAAAWARLELL